MTVRDVKVEFPQTIAIFQGFGFRDACDDCSIEIVARRQGLAPIDVVDELNRLVFGPEESVR